MNYSSQEKLDQIENKLSRVTELFREIREECETEAEAENLRREQIMLMNQCTYLLERLSR